MLSGREVKDRRRLGLAPRRGRGYIMEIDRPCADSDTMRKTRALIPIIAAAAAAALSARAVDPPSLVLAERGWTDYVIVLAAGAPTADVRAADLLRSSIEAISGAVLSIVSDDRPAAEKEILLGRGRRFAETPGAPALDGLGDDGYHYRTVGTRLFIGGGREKGGLYGVAAFLETRARLPEIREGRPPPPASRPGSRSRLSTCAACRPSPTAKSSCPTPSTTTTPTGTGSTTSASGSGIGGSGSTPSGRSSRPRHYFKDHPEYFTEQNGIRVPDAQLCLTNPDVFRLVVEDLRARMKEKPEAKYWSVSQNDTFSPCQCPACRAMDEKYGGPSGTLLDFVNRVAREFPDKIISTLAYQYSRQAPTGITPEKNVNIMLCTIECNRSRPIETRPGQRLVRQGHRGTGAG